MLKPPENIKDPRHSIFFQHKLVFLFPLRKSVRMSAFGGVKEPEKDLYRHMNKALCHPLKVDSSICIFLLSFLGKSRHLSGGRILHQRHSGWKSWMSDEYLLGSEVLHKSFYLRVSMYLATKWIQFTQPIFRGQCCGTLG